MLSRTKTILILAAATLSLAGPTGCSQSVDGSSFPDGTGSGSDYADGTGSNSNDSSGPQLVGSPVPPPVDVDFDVAPELEFGNPIIQEGDVILTGHGETGSFIVRMDLDGNVTWLTEVDGTIDEVVIRDGDKIWVVSNDEGSTAYSVDVESGHIINQLDRDAIYDLQVADGQVAVMSLIERQAVIERFNSDTLELVDRFENTDGFVLGADGRIYVTMNGGDGFSVLGFDHSGELLNAAADFVDPPFMYLSGDSLVVLGNVAGISAANPYEVFGYTSDLDEVWHFDSVFNTDVDPVNGTVLVATANDTRTEYELAELDWSTGQLVTVIEGSPWGLYQPATVDDTRYYVPYGLGELPTFIVQDVTLTQSMLSGNVWPELIPVRGHGLIVRPTEGIRDFSCDLTMLRSDGTTAFSTPVGMRSDRPLLVTEDGIILVEGSEVVQFDFSGDVVSRVEL